MHSIVSFIHCMQRWGSCASSAPGKVYHSAVFHLHFSKLQWRFGQKQSGIKRIASISNHDEGRQAICNVHWQTTISSLIVWKKVSQLCITLLHATFTSRGPNEWLDETMASDKTKWRVLLAARYLSCRYERCLHLLWTSGKLLFGHDYLVRTGVLDLAVCHAMYETEYIFVYSPYKLYYVGIWSCFH